MVLCIGAPRKGPVLGSRFLSVLEYPRRGYRTISRLLNRLSSMVPRRRRLTSKNGSEKWPPHRLSPHRLFSPSTDGEAATVVDEVVPGPLVGNWSGTYGYYSTNSLSDGPFSLNIIFHNPDGNFEGSGRDGVGDFTVRGHLRGTEISFTNSYPSTGTSWLYTGNLKEDGSEISGKWPLRKVRYGPETTEEREGDSETQKVAETVCTRGTTECR